MIEVMLNRKGDWLVPHSEHVDGKLLKEGFSQDEQVRAQLYSVSAAKARSYDQLCMYHGACRQVAMNIPDDPKWKNWTNHDKVDTSLKLLHSFYNKDDFIVYPGNCPQCNHTYDQVRFILKSLSYKNCNSSLATSFITQAMETSAGILGVTPEEMWSNAQV